MDIRFDPKLYFGITFFMLKLKNANKEDVTLHASLFYMGKPSNDTDIIHKPAKSLTVKRQILIIELGPDIHLNIKLKAL